jgi:hypothetical protein
MHRKTREIPVGQIVAFVVMFLAAVGLIVGMSAVTPQPAQASTTGYLSPAVTAAYQIIP